MKLNFRTLFNSNYMSRGMVISFLEKYELLTEFDIKEPIEDKVMSYRKGFLFKRKN